MDATTTRDDGDFSDVASESNVRLLHALNLVLAVLLIGFSVYVYPDLPDRIPTNFDGGGEPRRWSDTSLVSWLMLPGIGVLTAGLLYGVGVLAPAKPQLINLPGKTKLLQLPRAAQRWVMQGVATTMFLSATTLLAMFMLLQYGIWRSAMGHTGRGAITAGLIVGLAVMPVVALSSIVVAQRRIDAAAKWRAG